MPAHVVNQTISFSATATDNAGASVSKVVDLSVLANPSANFELLHGRSDGKGIDLVITGDGFTATQQNDLVAMARDYATYLASEQDAGVHYDFWNIIVVKAISNESGADHGSAGGLRDTKFSAQFNCNGMERLLCVNSGDVRRYVNEHAPQVDQKLVAVNDRKYGGAGYTSANMGTYSRVASAQPLALHEMAHSFADLADEYNYGNCRTFSEPSAVNATINNNRETVKWRHWLDNEHIDLFEGGRYCAEGVWRPAHASAMRLLGQPFYAVNAEQWALSAYHVAGTHLAKYPEIANAGVQTFAVTPYGDSSVQQVLWYVDGVLVNSDAGSQGRALTAQVTTGQRVEARISDVSGRIRVDRNGDSSSTIVWTVQ